jgi:hypothetical protein
MMIGETTSSAALRSMPVARDDVHPGIVHTVYCLRLDELNLWPVGC